MTQKEMIERNIGLTFDFVDYLMDNKEEMEKLPKNFQLRFIEKDFAKIERKNINSSINQEIENKYVQVKNTFDLTCQ